MSLVTRCPKCQSDFMVSLEQLRVHDGLVRCGNCTHIFDGQAALESQLPVLTQRAAHLRESLDSSSGASAQVAGEQLGGPPQRESSAHAKSSFNRVPHRLVLQQPVQEPARAPVQAPSAPSVLRRRAQTGAELDHEPEEPFNAIQPEPSFYQAQPSRGPEPRSEREPTLEHEPTFGREPTLEREPPLGREPTLRVQGEARLRDDIRPSSKHGTPDFLIDETPLDGLRRALWTLLVLVAGVLLLMQLAYVYRNELVTRVPSLLPMARLACVQLRCEVSFVRHLERITVESTALEQVAAGQAEGQASQLMLKFSMRNRNDKIQPWPHIAVELKDASGTVVVRKVLGPELYLPESLVAKPFNANQEVHLSVPIVVTDLQISGFQLNRFFP